LLVVAAGGVLVGKRATTHWRYAERLAQRHPAIHVEPDALYIDNGQVITSAGSAAGLDMLLHLVRRDYGARVGNMVAQRLVVAPHREGGQAQFLPRPMPADEAGRLARLMEWLRRHPARPHTVATMARQAAMSPRTLQRQFRDSTGMGPVEWLTRERVAIAKELLETPLPLAQVAEQAGFGSEETLRHHFRRVAATTPGAYRKAFLVAGTSVD
jgi:AraC family transcriptional activator FtrA